MHRDLRKGLEDAKNEPGAADFYYGEMEMRRLAARGGKARDTTDAEQLQPPPWAERRLLDAYWAISGYGLRAWRALAALAVLLVASTVLFTQPAFAHLPDSPPQMTKVDLRTGQISYGAAPGTPGGTEVPFSRALEHTVRESIAFARAGSTPLLTTTGAGTALNIALRLLAPILLGLTILAVRARTKR